jgi:hypothetical protein
LQGVANKVEACPNLFILLNPLSNIAYIFKYWTISFKSTWGVMHNPFYLFDILAAAKFLHDTSKISAFELKFLSFLPFFFFLGAIWDLCDHLEVQQRPE